MADGPPEQKARWFYAIEDRWQTFSDEDDTKLERRWEKVSADGSLEKKKQELKEKEEKEWKEDEVEGQQQDVGLKKRIPLLRAPPSGVDQVRKGVIESMSSSSNNRSKEEKEEEKGEKAESSKSSKKEEKTIVNEQLDPDEPEENRRFRIEVMEDHLFEVDLGKMQLFPVFWKGVLLKVIRATWFYASLDTGGYAPIPYDEGLSSDLEKAYEKAKPWEKIPAKTDDKENEEKEELLYDLPSMDNKGKIRFQDSLYGRIFFQDFTGKVMALLGGSLVIRGWQETARRSQSRTMFQKSFLPWAGGSEQEDGNEEDVDGSKRAQSKEGAAKAPSKAPVSGSSSSSSSSGGKSDEGEQQQGGGILRLWPSSDGLLRPGVNLLRSLGWSKKDANEEGQRAAKQKNTEKSLKNDGEEKEQEDDGIPDDYKDDPPELVLAIHGIGQKMVEEWDAIDFVYDVEKLRNLSKKVAGNSSMRKVARGKRAQYLPISWRKDLNFDAEEAREGNDNTYTLNDITNHASIPIVRNVISKVILDVPYYLSRHKERMIEAVKAEINRVYRLFVKRNPSFEEKGGRVSLICHSLGSAIAADILSNQPTYVSPLLKQTADELKSNKHLLFNVKNLFFIGSPVAFFFHLEGIQLIARKGTARTKNVAQDAAIDDVGRSGCLAAEAIYNCYNSTDPVAFQLSATVDAQYARSLHPISIPDAVPALLEALAVPRLNMSKLFDPVHPFAKGVDPAYKVETRNAAAAGPSSSSSQTNSGVNTPKKMEKGEERNTVLIETGSAQKKNQVKAKTQGEGLGEKGKFTKSGNTQPFDLERLERAERRWVYLREEVR